MTLKTQSIASAGDLDRERLVFQATADGDTGYYVVLRARAAADDRKPLSGNVPNAYWFPDQEIKKNDLVVLYTKRGRSSEKTDDKGRTSYFFYWGLDAPIWAVPNHRVVLIDSAEWSAFNDGPEEPK